MRKLTLAAAAAAVLGLFAGSAWAGTIPSSKVAVTYGDLFGLASACAIDGASATADCKGDGAGTGDTDDTGYVTVMTSWLRTPNGKELAFDISLQCGLITFTKSVAKGGGSGGSKTNADGRIQVRIGLTPVDNDGNDVGPTGYAFPNSDGSNPLGGPASGDSGPDGVTYCHRFQELEVTFENLICLSATTTDPADDCEIAVSLLLETLNVHSFNFIYPNIDSGLKRIEVQARATANAKVFSGTVDAAARGEAFIGMGSMYATTVRAVEAYDANTGPNPSFEDLN